MVVLIYYWYSCFFYSFKLNFYFLFCDDYLLSYFIIICDNVDKVKIICVVVEVKVMV